MSLGLRRVAAIIQCRFARRTQTKRLHSLARVLWSHSVVCKGTNLGREVATRVPLLQVHAFGVNGHR